MATVVLESKDFDLLHLQLGPAARSSSRSLRREIPRKDGKGGKKFVLELDTVWRPHGGVLMPKGFPLGTNGLLVAVWSIDQGTRLRSGRLRVINPK